MRLPFDPAANAAKRELSDLDRARIDARLARFNTAFEFAQAGLVVGEDVRKVTQLYEQLSAQAGSRGEAFPAMESWLQQRAQERLAQGYLPTMPVARAAQPFQLAMSEAASLIDSGRAAAATAAGEGEVAAPPAAGRDLGPAPAAVEGLLGQLALGQQGWTEAASDASATPAAAASAPANATTTTAALVATAAARLGAVDAEIEPFARHREGDPG